MADVAPGGTPDQPDPGSAPPFPAAASGAPAGGTPVPRPPAWDPPPAWGDPAAPAGASAAVPEPTLVRQAATPEPGGAGPDRGSWPGASPSDGSWPGGAAPGGAWPGGAAPGGAWPGGAAPGGAWPGAAAGQPGPGLPGGPGPYPVPAVAGDRRAARRAAWRRWLPLVGAISFITVCTVVMLVLLGFNLGLTSLFVGLAAAILPVPVIVGCFLWLDRYEPEPPRYLAFCFAWGAAVATLASLLVNSGMSALLTRVGLPGALVAVLVAPFIEELTKALGPLLLLWRRRREWSGITDGIVYCGVSAVGFAMVENVLYLGGHGYATGAEQYGPATGLRNVFMIFVARVLFFGFAHPLFTAMTGIGLGIAARTADRRVRWLAPLAGLLLAMILHGMFNLLPTLTTATGEALIMLYGHLGFMVPLFFAMVGLAIGIRGWEGRLSERVLPHYVRAGWLSPPEVAALSSLGRRHSARRWANRVSGQTGARAMRGFQFAATRLALLRDGMQRGLDTARHDAERSAAEERRLLEEISGYRSVFTGRDPQMPQAFWDGANYRIAFPDGVTRTVPPPDEPVVPVPVRLPAGGSYGLPWGGPAPVPAGPPGAYPGGGWGQAPAYGAPAPYGQQPPPPYGAPQRAPSYGAPPLGPGAAPEYRSTPGYGTGYDPSGYGGPGYGGPGYGGPGYGAPAPGPGSPPPAASADPWATGERPRPGA